MLFVPDEGEAARSARYRVLLVEDDVVDQKIFRKFVTGTELPYDCTIVGSVSKAREAFESKPFDIVISDYLLGDGTAFDILHLAKEAPVIVVTGAGDEEIAIRTWKAGAYDYLVKDLHGDYLKALAITIKNTIEHKRAERQLELLCGAIMSAEDCIYITDMHGKIIFVNSAFCRTYGYTDKEILGKDSSILWTGVHPHMNTGCVLEIRTAGGGRAVGFYHERQDGGMLPVSLSRSIIKDSNGKDVAVVGIARDMSERVLLMDELCAEISNLTAHNRQYGKLVITVMETLKSLIESKNLDRALRVIAGFRQILEIETEETQEERTDVDLGSLISQIVETLRPVVTERNIDLQSHVPGAELVVNADRGHTVQALTSIIRSLTDVVPPESHVSIRAGDAGNGVTIEIESNDSTDAVGRIHEAMNGSNPFREHLDPHGDLGLELFVTKRLVELHGGTVSVGGKDRQRNTLFITLPKSDAVRKDPSPVGSSNQRTTA
jgi:PAS domain S-box-containing protein